MTFKELFDRLQHFNCEAFADKEVAHCFVDKNGYGYKETIENIAYDAKNKTFIVKCSNPVQFCWDGTAVVE